MKFAPKIKCFIFLLCLLVTGYGCLPKPFSIEKLLAGAFFVFVLSLLYIAVASTVYLVPHGIVKLTKKIDTFLTKPLLGKIAQRFLYLCNCENYEETENWTFKADLALVFTACFSLTFFPIITYCGLSLLWN